MRTLVTGGAGFIGSALVDRLLASGHAVTVVDSFRTGSPANLTPARARFDERLVVHELDLRDPALAEVVAAARPEVVIHLAAQVDVRVSVADPVLDASINVLGSVAVLEAARQAGATKVVYAASGGTLYGEPDPSRLPLREQEPWCPVSPYGVSKRAVLDYLAAYRHLYGIEATSLALANVYGPRQDATGEAAVVAAFATRLLAGEPCTIYGDGLQTRDFVYVDDVVDAFVLAMDRADGAVLNIGTGRETPVLELHRLMAEAAGSDVAPAHAPARTGELARSALDARAAAAELGWAPRTALADGLAATIDWFATHE